MKKYEAHPHVRKIAWALLASLCLACGSSDPKSEQTATDEEDTSPPPSPMQPQAEPDAPLEPSAEPEMDAPSEPATSPTEPIEPRPPATETEDASETPDAAAPNDVQSACYAAARDDVCDTCVCTECVQPLEDCAATPGCPEILACVLESGCTGLDCFCGSEPLPTCVGAEGAGNGPCRDQVLSAPGGRQPDLVNLSAGPASDSAIAVSTCATSEATCGSVCAVGSP
jgi:hypothetical protein